MVALKLRVTRIVMVAKKNDFAWARTLFRCPSAAASCTASARSRTRACRCSEWGGPPARCQWRPSACCCRWAESAADLRAGCCEHRDGLAYKPEWSLVVSTAFMERELSSVPLVHCYIIHVSKRTHILRVVVPVLDFEQLWQPEDHGALQLSLKTRRPPKLRGRKFYACRSS